MAVGTTIYTFTISLADDDQGVYENFELKAARHPSEAEDYLVTRVLAYCLDYAEGIAFSRGISDPGEPPLGVRDLTGALRSWIEIGAPNAARLHKPPRPRRGSPCTPTKTRPRCNACTRACTSNAPGSWGSMRWAGR